ncbi:alpha/beta fold hydrolase [Mycobacterium simiae]|uniref:alpha/beta fold hydrolase n=1 Tax=Mycobacterium simiae TaxID=1784 RepID=UPI00261945A7|nr:alpha/beta hydrolase [Mycobacterium simiae]
MITAIARPRGVLIVTLIGLLMAGAAGVSGAPHHRMATECGGELAGFSQREVQVGQASIHVVIGGHGPTVLLLHGFPETWWTWRQVMPLLADTHTVIAADLRGVGCSSLGPGPYDADTLARDMHAVVHAMNVSPLAVVGHDTGGWVAYAYARQYRDEVTHLVLSGAAIPGFGVEALLDFRAPGPALAHLAFFLQPQVPELLIGGREKQYFHTFISSAAMARSGVIDIYARAYARPGRLTAALGQYRSVYVDAANNRRQAAPPLAMPTLAVSGSETRLSADDLRQVAQQVSEVTIPHAAHYVQEEQPEPLARALQQFLH